MKTITALGNATSVKTLATRLLAAPGKDAPAASQAKMEAALVRLNPQLSQIGNLDKETPIIVPDGFTLAPKQAFAPMQSLGEELLQQAELALDNLRAVMQERLAQFQSQTDEVQTWLKGSQAKDLVKESPELKDVFSSAAEAAKTVAKEQPAALAVQIKALDKVQTQLTVFRTQRASVRP
jgi:enamine deaminase RidA (YjgF/YER057c/UK114 family)